MSIEKVARKVLDQKLVNNDKNILELVLNFIRCEDCKQLEMECFCLRCDGVCFEKIKYGCKCNEHCDHCKQRSDVDVHSLCENCPKTYKLCKTCHIHLEENKPQCNCQDTCYGDYGDSDCECDECMYNRMKANQIW